MARAERAKGKIGELEVVRLLRASGWPLAERTSNGRLQGSADIANGPEACLMEVRRRERLNVPAALAEVAEKAGAHDVPVVVHRRSNERWIASLPFDELLALLYLRERG